MNVAQPLVVRRIRDPVDMVPERGFENAASRAYREFKKCPRARCASRYSDRAVDGCTHELLAFCSVLGHQADSVAQSVLSASLIMTSGSPRAPSKKGGRNTMTNETILYLSDHATNSNSVLAALKATGYEIVSTNSATQAIALVYVLHTVAGVVLN